MTKSFSFKEIFDNTFSIDGENIRISKIVIPIIQRDYAQGRMDPDIKRVRQRFLSALYDAITVKPIKLDFIYGNIDTEKDCILTPLDGQQRLTTLFLLYWYVAKKEKISKEEYSFLTKFSYETRYSARDFCEKLIEFDPTFTKKTVSEEIINQSWFPWEWKKDPTISSMLTMIDDIRDKFYNINDIWNKIDSSIQFFFLPIHDMGLTDELYIKMNSRGKPLSLFENFKAELEYEFKENSVIDYMEIINKIDKNWTDLLWQFKDEYNSIDNSFLHYFRFVCDVICYKNDDTPSGKNLDEIELIKEYFSAQDDDFVENVDLLVKYFDCWVNISKKIGIDNFFGKYISDIHENGKIILDKNKNLFEDILQNYGQMVENSKRRQFPLSRFILFYAFLIYCINIDAIAEKDFKRRIRIVNNLINNSEYEISNSTARTGGNRIPAILKQVDSIVLKGEINDSLGLNFNARQLSEEKEKLLWTNQNPELSNNLFELEDHKLLYGQISIIGLENYNLFNRFKNLFACDYGKVGMALLTIDNYSVGENSWRYQLGSVEPTSYSNLFHSDPKKSQNLKITLCKLLMLNNNFNDDYLNSMINDYIEKCEQNSLFDWRYYYLKYKEFRPGRFGKYCWNDQVNKPYEFDVIWSQLNLSENAYNPFLKAVDKKDKLSRSDFGRKIIDNNKYIVSNNEGFSVYSVDTNSLIDKITVQQDENGIDRENRIEKMINEYNY